MGSFPSVYIYDFFLLKKKSSVPRYIGLFLCLQSILLINVSMSLPISYIIYIIKLVIKSIQILQSFL